MCDCSSSTSILASIQLLLVCGQKASGEGRVRSSFVFDSVAGSYTELPQSPFGNYARSHFGCGAAPSGGGTTIVCGGGQHSLGQKFEYVYYTTTTSH